MKFASCRQVVVATGRALLCFVPSHCRRFSSALNTKNMILLGVHVCL